MSYAHLARRSGPGPYAPRVRRPPRTVDWRLLALGGFFLALLAAEIAITVAVAPTVDPLTVVAVP